MSDEITAITAIGILNQTLVPRIGLADNSHNAETVFGKLNQIIEHLHAIVFLYPARAGSIQLQKAAGAWAAYPTPTEIIPANIITLDYDLHFMNISAISANGEYTINIYSGSAGNEVTLGEYGAARNAVQSQEGSREIITRLLPANTRISAAISSENVGQDTLNIKVEGHVY